MKTRFLSYGAAWLACITMICPAVALGDRAPHAAIQDVELTRTGDLSGQILNRQGLPIGAVALTLNTNSGVLSSQSNQNGEFTFANVGGGTCQLTAGGKVQTVRAWQNQTAPPVAAARLLVVADEPVVRGQYGPGPMIDGGCGPAGCGPACGPGCGPGCGDPCGGPGCGGGRFSWFANPWVIGAAIAAAIVIPVALSNNDDDSASP